jgi:hypothetical protein
MQQPVWGIPTVGVIIHAAKVVFYPVNSKLLEYDQIDELTVSMVERAGARQSVDRGRLDGRGQILQFVIHHREHREHRDSLRALCVLRGDRPLLSSHKNPLPAPLMSLSCNSPSRRDDLTFVALQARTPPGCLRRKWFVAFTA